ncbi:MAG TPA: FtsL-like putative cell division protein [Chitinophagaceae bacterium]|nr:FtsL-like putative cell division protein [Chitinophagaceae bacterium]
MQELQNAINQDPVSTRTGPAVSGWKKWLNYSSIVKQVPFFLFLALLAVIYIYNGHNADKTIRNINRTAKEVKELQYEYKSVKSEVMFRSKESELVKAVEPLGLKELLLPPAVLSSPTKNN